MSGQPRACSHLLTVLLANMQYHTLYATVAWATVLLLAWCTIRHACMVG